MELSALRELILVWLEPVAITCGWRCCRGGLFGVDLRSQDQYDAAGGHNELKIILRVFGQVVDSNPDAPRI